MKQLFKVGDEVEVRCADVPFTTIITHIEWNTLNKCWFYYFLDEKGNQSCENSAPLFKK